jgi:histidyl-tRNA synthetase
VARSFGYEEIDGPNIESFDLFASKSGEELVNQQMYTLEDRDGNKLGIRPEITPTYARMVAKKQGELIFPLKCYI